MRSDDGDPFREDMEWTIALAVSLGDKDQTIVLTVSLADKGETVKVDLEPAVCGTFSFQIIRECMDIVDSASNDSKVYE